MRTGNPPGTAVRPRQSHAQQEGKASGAPRRHRLEAELRASEDRFRLVLENSPSPIGVFDQTGSLRYISPTIAAVFGLSPEEMLRRAALVHPLIGQIGPAELTPARQAELGLGHVRNAATWLHLMEKVIYCAEHPGEKVQFEARLHSDIVGQRDYELVIQGFQHETCEVVVILHDVTALRQLERLLSRRNVELEQQVAARTADLEAAVAQLEHALAELQAANAGKDAFLAAVSHELRTPLTGILTMAEVLESEVRGPLNDAQTGYVAVIAASGRRLSATINDVLRYTSLVAGKQPLLIGSCNVVDLCTEVVRAQRPAAEAKGHQLTLAVTPPEMEIESDPQGIRQILHELLDNAVKFSPAGARIHLAAVPAGEPAAEGTGGVRFIVTDTGIGMDAEQQAAIFRPFVQGDRTLARRYEGLGLGLAFVYEMVTRLRGTVTVLSAPGAGSSFTVTLPALLVPPLLPTLTA
ncbi:MAG: ATP-binding protein [Caldilineaceae bacterium]